MEGSMKRNWACLLALMVAVSACTSKHLPEEPRREPQAVAIDADIEALLAKMTLEEKITLIGGIDSGAAMIGGDLMGTRAIPRLGIPSIKMSDGPIGVRNGPNTAFPSGVNMGATFNPDLIREVAVAMADETRAIGKNMLLGPCVNIARVPLGGRNFESFGEDPYLNSQYSREYVFGLQSRDVISSVKHWALNEQEFERDTIDTIADARTMHEMHFPAFKAGVDAGAYSVMSSFNKVNGKWASENDYLLNKVLKERWGFKGFVISDWVSVHSTVDAANAGLDLEMPLPDFFAADKLIPAIRSGQVKQSTIDDKARRILRAIFAAGLMGPRTKLAQQQPAPKGPTSPEHKALALKLARESIVLLKNESVLPLRKGLKSVAIIGPAATDLQSGGGGSSKVIPAYVIQPLQAFKERMKGVEIRHALGSSMPSDREAITDLAPAAGSSQKGLQAEYFNGPDMTGPPIRTELDTDLFFDHEKTPDPKLPERFSVRWTGYFKAPESGRYLFTTESHEGNRLIIDGKEVITDWKAHHRIPNRAEVRLEGGKWYPIKIEYFNTTPKKAYIRVGWSRPYKERAREAVKVATGADVAIVFAGVHESLEGEGVDRKTLDLPVGQSELIRAVAKVNPNTIVVLNGGGAFAMSSWLKDVKGVVHAFFPGQEGGYAIYDVLTGVVNPSAKLPISFPKRIEDSSSYGNFPGKNGRVEYKEGIFVGYRFNDAKKIEPLFPFGFGLSYTQFKYSNLDVRIVNPSARTPEAVVSFDVTNVGQMAGAEIAQLYVGEIAPALPRPPRELKGFKRLSLAPGETGHAELALDASSFAYFDAKEDKWKVKPGKFRIEVGASSRDLKLRREITLAAE